MQYAPIVVSHHNGKEGRRMRRVSFVLSPLFHSRLANKTSKTDLAFVFNYSLQRYCVTSLTTERATNSKVDIKTATRVPSSYI